MASNTPRLNLLKKDPLVDGADTFNIKTMSNDNLDKIDAGVALKSDVDGKYTKPAGGIPKADLSTAVQTSLEKADSAATGEALTNHKADYTTHTGYAASSGTANAYIATLTPALSAYAEGVSLRLKINVGNTGASTVNVNGLGAKSIKKANGTDVGSGNLKAGSVYTLVYNGTNFILQGEGGDLSDTDKANFISSANNIFDM